MNAIHRETEGDCMVNDFTKMRKFSDLVSEGREYNSLEFHDRALLGVLEISHAPIGHDIK